MSNASVALIIIAIFIMGSAAVGIAPGLREKLSFDQWP